MAGNPRKVFDRLSSGVGVCLVLEAYAFATIGLIMLWTELMDRPAITTA